MVGCQVFVAAESMRRVSADAVKPPCAPLLAAPSKQAAGLSWDRRTWYTAAHRDRLPEDLHDSRCGCRINEGRRKRSCSSPSPAKGGREV